jgi:hypothetical protein
MLPERSGLLIKEARVADKARNEMAIERTAGDSVQELFGRGPAGYCASAAGRASTRAGLPALSFCPSST